jgi:magnesium chelatase subunit I
MASESIQSLTDLIERASARRFLDAPAADDLGLAEQQHFPFLAMVGQEEMKLALLLALVNPNVGGVLLIGPRGTGKTTAVRSLTDLMPDVKRSRCPYGCVEHEIEAEGMDAVCPDCAKRYAEGEPLSFTDRARLIELPLNSELEDVVGGLDERAAVHRRLRLRRGLLAMADQNILHVDEVNLLQDQIVDAILDAAAQGTYSVHRGPLAATYRSRFVLVGSMNPEEGNLRPQILDRFGLRVIVRGLESPNERLEAYRRTIAFHQNPREVIHSYVEATELARREISDARTKIHEARLQPDAEAFGLQLIQDLKIDSLRSEITLFEAARAHAVADGRVEATRDDVLVVASSALRLRRSEFMREFFSQVEVEEEELRELLGQDDQS